LEWRQRRYHIAGNAFARRKADWKANGEKVDFVAVRNCVSGDSAGVSRNSNFRLLRLEFFGRVAATAEMRGEAKEKMAKYLRLENFSGLCFLRLDSNSNSRFAIRNSVSRHGTVFDIA
jgi:hypothetical protein